MPQGRHDHDDIGSRLEAFDQRCLTVNPQPFDVVDRDQPGSSLQIQCRRGVQVIGKVQDATSGACRLTLHDLHRGRPT